MTMQSSLAPFVCASLFESISVRLIRMTIPIFILSNFRSGSTLLRYVLDAHPDICCPSELRLASFSQYVFQVVDLTRGDETQATDDDIQCRLRLVRSTVDRLMDDYCRRKGKVRWCDKSPGNTEMLFILGSVFPDAHYICLHRHALDQVYSALDVEGPVRLHRYLERQGGDVVSAAIDRWCTRAERLLAFEHEHRHRVTRVLYERFVEDPEAELARLCRFLEVPLVSGLSKAAFAQAHDRGPRDIKIAGAKRVERDRIGKGRTLDLKRVSIDLHERLTRLIEALAYPLEETTLAVGHDEAGPARADLPPVDRRRGLKSKTAVPCGEADGSVGRP